MAITSLILRLTERCNLRCAYCYAALPGRRVPDMSQALAIQAVRACCPEGGSLDVQFTGGEPLLALPVMEAVYAFGKETGRKLRLSVQTNATPLSPDVCRRLAAIHCAVGVSLDGMAAANALRVFPDGNPSFTAAVEGIRNLGQCGIRCGMTTVVTSVSAPYLGRLPDLALWLGNVDGVGLDLFRPLGRGAGQNLAPEPEVLAAGLEALCRRTMEVRKTGYLFQVRELERIKRRRAQGSCSGLYCYAQTDRSLAVDGSGSCWPCSSLTGVAGFYLGNIRDGIPKLPIAASCLPAPPECTRCPSLSICLGGCPARRLTSQNRTDTLLCTMTKTLAAQLTGA